MRLIDADEVLARIENPYQKAEIARWLRDAPTIERKRGEWIKMPYHVTECSECGFSLEDWIQGAFYNYCPNCGSYNGVADM